MSDLFYACKRGDIAELRGLISNGLDPRKDIHDLDFMWGLRTTPLHLASRYGLVEIVKMLIDDYHCSTECTDHYGSTPLHVASEYGHVETVKMLIEDYHCSTECTYSIGRTPLHVACVFRSVSVIEYLVENQDVKLTYAGKSDGSTILHLACRENWLNIVRVLIEKRKVDVNTKDIDGNGFTPIHVACLKHSVSLIEYLVKNEDVELTYNGKSDGSTILHLACRKNWLNIVRVLIEKRKVDVNTKDGDGYTPIHIACLSGLVEIVKILIEDSHCSTECTDSYGRTPLHVACEYGLVEIVKMLIEDYHCSTERTDSYGRTSLHVACEYGHVETVKILIEDYHCSTECTDSDGRTPLHTACEKHSVSLIEYLVKNQDVKLTYDGKSDGSTILHLACRENWLNIVRILTERRKADVNTKDDNGYTPIHIALLFRRGYYDLNQDIVTVLVKSGNANLDCALPDGRTPLDLVSFSEHVRLFLELGATPTYKLYGEYFPSHLQKTQAEMSIKMFVIGNPGAGKSTLVESLKTVSGLLHFFFKVKGVQEKTAGVIPHDFKDKSLGTVSLYDFAGHEEFHSSHEVLLSSSVANSASIIMLVVNIRDEHSVIKSNATYWLELVNNQCYLSGTKPHLVVVCSHVDESKNVNEKLGLIVELTKSYTQFQYIGEVQLDCRYAVSSGMTKLRSVLQQSCNSLRSSGEMAIECHCFFVFLLDKFKDATAITLGTVKEVVKNEAYVRFLASHNLHAICEQLSQRGNILFMTNKEDPEKSWIILNKTTLLTDVNGALFAPEGFKEHNKICSSTGVVPLSRMEVLFDGYNIDMITQYLSHLEFCYEVTDPKLLSLLPDDDIISFVTPNERFFFFPGLVHDDRPEIIWQPDEDYGNHRGWVTQCFRPEQFFTRRFHHILLLRLMFYFALPPSTPSAIEHPALQGQCTPLHPALLRRCSVWKNGVSWANTSGGKAIVEITDKRQIVVLTCCRNGHELESGRLLSDIIFKVLEAKNEFCTSVDLTERVIFPEDTIKYPINLTSVTTVSITDVARNISENTKYVVLEKESSPHLELETLLNFEPYINMADVRILQELLDPNIPEHHKTVTREFIECFAEQIDSTPERYVSIFKGRLTSIPADIDVTKALEMWKKKMGPKATRCNLHKMLDKFSVFAGRNPLKVASGDTSLPDGHFSPESDLPSTSGDVFRHNESSGDSATSITSTSLSRGHGEPQEISQGNAKNDEQSSPRSTIQSQELMKHGRHESYELILSKRNIPDDEDDEESKNDKDVFTKPTKSTYVAKSEHCDDHTSRQSRRTSIGGDILRHNESNGAYTSPNRGHGEPQEISQSNDKQFSPSHKNESHGKTMEKKSSFDHLEKGDRPEPYQLQLVKGRNHKKIRIMDQVTPQWKDLAVALHFDGPRIETIDQTAFRKPEDACRDMFFRWLDGEYDLEPATWGTLHQCLIDAGLVELADDLQECLSL